MNNIETITRCIKNLELELTEGDGEQTLRTFVKDNIRELAEAWPNLLIRLQEKEEKWS